MEGKGVGRVVEANLGLESFKVDFERFKGLTVGFKAAPKLLRPCRPDHVLRRKLEDPAGSKALPPARAAARDPPELRPPADRRARSATPSTGLVTESQWTSWWAAARKHPQVVASGGGGRQTYRWAETSGDALDSVWKAFEKAEPRRKIELLSRDGARDPDLRRRMAEELARVGDEARRRRPRARLRDLVRPGAQRRRPGGRSPGRRTSCSPSPPTPRACSPGSRTGCCASAPTPCCASGGEDWPAIYLRP